MSKKIITEFEAGERLDKTLARLFPEYSRSAIEKLITAGAAQINDAPVKTKYTLKPTDTITINFDSLDKAVEEIELPVLYEDENVVVINKPIGVLAHTKGAFNKEGTVASWLKTHVSGVPNPDLKSSKKEITKGDTKLDWNPDQAGDDRTVSFWQSNRAGIVHRLDRATSGIMICAKNEATQTHIQKQFSNRNVKKTYLAVISGHLPEKTGFIDIPIERNPKKPATFRAGVNGKSAQTGFTVLKTSEKYSLIELKPQTGRTHQLRVHLKYLKHPIVGDEFYDGEEADRLMLHAYQLELTLPGGARKNFTAPVPEVFNDYAS